MRLSSTFQAGARSIATVVAMRIGELAAAAQSTTKTLRFYEETGLLPQTVRAPRCDSRDL
jgi:hypothetical protein